jgi:hypothetical protein
MRWGGRALGVTVSLLAAASLVLDYVLTVEVSLAAGAAKPTWAFPAGPLPAGGKGARPDAADGGDLGSWSRRVWLFGRKAFRQDSCALRAALRVRETPCPPPRTSVVPDSHR